MEKKVEPIMVGFWLYDGHVKMPVNIIKQNWDYYFEDGYNDGKPDLNENGFAFYVVGEKDIDNSYSFRSQTFLSKEDAIEYANINMTKINWLDKI